MVDSEQSMINCFPVLFFIASYLIKGSLALNCCEKLMRFVPVILSLVVFYSCSSAKNSKENIAITQQSKIVEFKRIAVMDTVTAIIDGRITSLCSGKTLPAVVQLSNKNNAYQLTANLKGEFKLFHINAGQYKVTCTHSGYDSLKDSINLGTGDVAEMKIGLKCKHSILK